MRIGVIGRVPSRRTSGLARTLSRQMVESQGRQCYPLHLMSRNDQIDKVFLEDCRITADRISYHYVLTSPPDFHELGMSPTQVDSYESFLRSAFCLLSPLRGAITVVITDRKFQGGIIPKHSIVCAVLNEARWRLHSHKVWVKSFSANPFRLNYAHILSFVRGRRGPRPSRDFKPDVWLEGSYQQQGYRNAMPLGLAERCIENFTSLGDVVYDPFMGSGTTAVAAIRLARRYVGSETDPGVYSVCEGRLARELEVTPAARLASCGSSSEVSGTTETDAIWRHSETDW